MYNAKFWQDHFKRVLERAKLAYANKIKQPINSQKLNFHVFEEITKSILNIDEFTFSTLFNGPDMSPSASNKAELFAKIFYHLILIIQVYFYLFFLLELIWNCITFKLLWKFITNLDLSEVPVPDFIPMVVKQNCELEPSHILAQLFNTCSTWRIIWIFLHNPKQSL